MTALEVADWRRRVFALYSEVRAASDPATGHDLWRRGRDDLFSTHPATPLLPQDRGGFAGLPVSPYDPDWRFEVPITPAAPRHLEVETGTDGVVPFELLGTADLPGIGTLDVWRLASYCRSRMRCTVATAAPTVVADTFSTPSRGPTSGRVRPRSRSCSTSISPTTRPARMTRSGHARLPSRETRRRSKSRWVSVTSAATRPGGSAGVVVSRRS